MQEMLQIANQHIHKGTEIKDRKTSGSDPLNFLCLPTPKEANVPAMVTTSKTRQTRLRLALPKFSSMPSYVRVRFHNTDELN